MKKLFFVAFAALTLGLASCSEKAEKASEVAPFIEQMTSQLEAGSLDEMENTMDEAMAKVKKINALMCEIKALAEKADSRKERAVNAVIQNLID